MSKKLNSPRFDPSRYVPLGISWKKELGKKGIWNAVAMSVGLLFFWLMYIPAQNDLWERHGSEHVLVPGAVMRDFAECMQFALLMFLVVVLAELMQIREFYKYHREGSMSIYLMRRLPSRWELHRRCLAFPLLGLGLCAAAAFLTVVLCYAYYMIATPDACLTPGQWQKFWRLL